jgi:hypothetical protein
VWNSASASLPPIDLVGRLELCSGREQDRYLAIGTQILSGRVRTESFPNTHFCSRDPAHSIIIGFKCLFVLSV